MTSKYDEEDTPWQIYRALKDKYETPEEQKDALDSRLSDKRTNAGIGMAVLIVVAAFFGLLALTVAVAAVILFAMAHEAALMQTRREVHKLIDSE